VSTTVEINIIYVNVMIVEVIAAVVLAPGARSI